MCSSVNITIASVLTILVGWTLSSVLLHSILLIFSQETVFIWHMLPSRVLTPVPFMLQVRLGKNGVEEVLGLGELSDFEKQGLENLKGELKASIEKGIKFAHRN